MTQQLREAVAAKPDGIAMMGHPGDAAIMPLAEEAAKAGIKMMYQNVPRAAGGRQVRRRLCRRAAGSARPCARRRVRAPVGLKSGDLAIVLLASNDSEPQRARRGHRQGAGGGGVKVIQASPRAGMGCRSEPGDSRHHRRLAGQSDGQGDRLSRRAAARQRRPPT